MDVVGSLDNALKLVQRLKEVSKKVREAEIRNLLADLSNELADVKLSAASLKNEIAELKNENQGLKDQLVAKSSSKPRTKWGCYYFEDDDEKRLYCPACYDTKGQRNLTSRVDSKFRRCNVCKAELS